MVPTSLTSDEGPDPCRLRDEGEGEGEGEPEIVGIARGGLQRSLRHLIPLVAAVLVATTLIPAGRRKIRSAIGTILLASLALLAVGSYFELGPNDRYVNGWEFFHYYLGSRYAPEVGYTGLYEAALVADVETGRKFRHDKDVIRDLSTGGCISVDDVLARQEIIVSRFSPDRWAEFTQDIRYFKSTLPQHRWDGVFHDKGYNAPPSWTMLVGRVTNRVGTGGLLWLSLLDPLLLVLAVVAVWRTFGYRTALLMIILIGTHMTMSHSHMKGAFLRTDWVVSLVLAVCALREKRSALAGAFTAYAAASRVFPALFAVGLFAKVLIAWIRREDTPREPVRFSAGFVVILGLLLLASSLAAPSGTWGEFGEKIWGHHDSFSPWRVGFKHVFLGAYQYRPDSSHQEVFRDSWPLWWALQGMMLAGFAFLVRRLKSWEALALGFVPVFFLVAPTYYYYMMLVIPLLFFAGRIRRPECALGIVWLLLSSSIAYAVHDAFGRELQLTYSLSLMFLGVCLLMGISAFLEARRAQAPSERSGEAMAEGATVLAGR